MAELIFGWFFIAIAIACCCAFIAAVPKLIFFFRRRYAYTTIFKAGLLGELVGLFIILIVFLLLQNGLIEVNGGEVLISIPFSTMVAGVIIRSFQMLRENRSSSK